VVNNHAPAVLHARWRERHLRKRGGKHSVWSRKLVLNTSFLGHSHNLPDRHRFRSRLDALVPGCSAPGREREVPAEE